MGLRTAFPVPLGDGSVGVSVSPEPPSAIARWLLPEHKLCVPLETASSREQVVKYRRMARAVGSVVAQWWSMHLERVRP